MTLKTVCFEIGSLCECFLRKRYKKQSLKRKPSKRRTIDLMAIYKWIVQYSSSPPKKRNGCYIVERVSKAEEMGDSV